MSYANSVHKWINLYRYVINVKSIHNSVKDYFWQRWNISCTTDCDSLFILTANKDTYIIAANNLMDWREQSTPAEWYLELHKKNIGGCFVCSKDDWRYRERKHDEDDIKYQLILIRFLRLI